MYLALIISMKITAGQKIFKSNKFDMNDITLLL